MNIKDLQDYVREIVSDSDDTCECTAHLYLLLEEKGNGSKYGMYLSEFKDDGTDIYVRNLFCQFLRDRIINDDALKSDNLKMIPNLSRSDEVSSYIYKYDYDLDDMPDKLVSFRDFDNEQDQIVGYAYTKLPKFDFKKHSFDQIKGMLIHISNGKRACLLFKKYYQVNLIKRTKLVLGITGKGALKRFEGDFIKLDGKVELIKINNEIFVLDVKTLEGQLGLDSLIKKDAANGLDYIKKLNIVKNFDALKEHGMANLSLAKKLAKISRVSPVVTKNISKDTIINFAKGNDIIKDRFKFEEGQIKLTRKSMSSFLSLMNDSFLNSGLTNELYEAHAKDRLGTAKPLKQGKIKAHK